MWKYGERLMKSVSHGVFSFLYVDWLRMEICAFLYWKQLRCVEGSRLPSLPHTKKKQSSLCSFSNPTRYAPPIHPPIQGYFLFESESLAQFKMIRKTFATVRRYRLWCFSTDSCGAPDQTCQAFWAGLPRFQASLSKNTVYEPLCSNTSESNHSYC